LPSEERPRISSRPSLVEEVRGREGSHRRPGRRGTPTSHLLAKSLRHLTTVRGHHSPVYCLAVDRSGQYLITGSDDRLVKVCLSHSKPLFYSTCCFHPSFYSSGPPCQGT